jgi:hypothetical protein
MYTASSEQQRRAQMSGSSTKQPAIVMKVGRDVGRMKGSKADCDDLVEEFVEVTFQAVDASCFFSLRWTKLRRKGVRETCSSHGALCE